jgi:hypothetical protein
MLHASHQLKQFPRTPEIVGQLRLHGFRDTAYLIRILANSCAVCHPFDFAQGRF